MYKLIPTEKYSVKKIGKSLNFSTMLERGIRENFGDPISINELKLAIIIKKINAKARIMFSLINNNFGEEPFNPSKNITR